MKKVAFIDDCVISIELMNFILKPLGYDLYAYRYVEDILKNIPKDIDVVITDFIMFDMDGLTLISKLKEFMPETVKYIICTSYKTESMYKCCEEDNLTLVTKPYHTEQLIEAIEGKSN